MALETLELETGPDPVASVVWMHGLGADAHDFEPVVPMLALDARRPLRYVFPNAPVRPVTVNAGMRMRAWYDIRDLDISSRGDLDGVRESAAAITQLIEQERARGFAADRILLAGFSQGGAMALFAGLRYRDTLAGIIALSCYLPDPDTLAVEMPAANRGVPIFMAHGDLDPVVAPALGRSSRERLEAAGCSVSWHSYPMPHAVIPQELADIRSFLDRVISPRPAG